MLLAEINSVVKQYQDKFFTGHIKFGIEKSKVVSLTINSRLERSDNENAEYDKQLAELCSVNNFFGSIEFDLIRGKLERLNYCMSFNGVNLAEKLGGKNAALS